MTGALPFADCVFDGCLFCGSLHIFPDTRRVLKEVGRTLKSGARVVVTTVIHGDKGILKERGSRRPDPPNIKVFDLPELEVDIEESGFAHFDPEVHGCLLTFGMTRK